MGVAQETSYMAISYQSRKENDSNTRVIVITMVGMVFGYIIGSSHPHNSLAKHSPVDLEPSIMIDDNHIVNHSLPRYLRFEDLRFEDLRFEDLRFEDTPLEPNEHKIDTSTKPRGTESLPPDFIAAESDLYLRRLWGLPSEDLEMKPKYLVTFTVGLKQKNNIDAAVKKFSDDFQILLFHYDGRTTEWDQFEWSRRAIHITVKTQAKWWYAKRFLHPDIVSAYDYIFIWDEDLGLENFNPDKYIEIADKHGLEISQPGLQSKSGYTWQMTKRRKGREVHKRSSEKRGWCNKGRHLPPCAAFVEIMAPVFSRNSWRCVWHMIQNDLVHGWGLDFALQRCVEPAHEKIGVIDSEWIIHQEIPSLSEEGNHPRKRVKIRCRKEWGMFQDRFADADKQHYEEFIKG